MEELKARATAKLAGSGLLALKDWVHSLMDLSYAHGEMKKQPQEN